MVVGWLLVDCWLVFGWLLVFCWLVIEWLLAFFWLVVGWLVDGVEGRRLLALMEGRSVGVVVVGCLLLFSCLLIGLLMERRRGYYLLLWKWREGQFCHQQLPIEWFIEDCEHQTMKVKVRGNLLKLDPRQEQLQPLCRPVLLRPEGDEDCVS